MSSVPPVSPSTSAHRSGPRGRSSVPVGIYVVVGLGFLGALLGGLASLEVIGRGYPVLGLVLLALAAGEAIVVFGLLQLKTWAWLLSLVLYGLGAIVDLVAGNLVGLLISFIIVVYLLSVANRFD